MRHLYQDTLKGFYYLIIITTMMSITAYGVINLFRGY